MSQTHTCTYVKSLLYQQLTKGYFEDVCVYPFEEWIKGLCVSELLIFQSCLPRAWDVQWNCM